MFHFRIVVYTWGRHGVFLPRRGTVLCIIYLSSPFTVKLDITEQATDENRENSLYGLFFEFFDDLVRHYELSTGFIGAF